MKSLRPTLLWRMKITRKTILISLAAGFLLIGAGLGGWWIYKKLTHNPAASCANCRLQLAGMMEQYQLEKGDGWYPRGGRTPADSLAALVKWTAAYGHPLPTHIFTSHKLAPPLAAYYSQHGTLTYEFMCYRYNEGLRQGDTGNLVILYYFQPTRWECNIHRMNFLGRPVWSGGSWEFIPEAEFQKRQQATLEYLQANKRR